MRLVFQRGGDHEGQYATKTMFCLMAFRDRMFGRGVIPMKGSSRTRTLGGWFR